MNIFEKSVMRNVFGPHRVQITRDRRKFRSERCPVTIYYLGDKIEENAMKSGHLTCMGEKKDAYSISVGKSEGKGHFADLGIDGRIILR